MRPLDETMKPSALGPETFTVQIYEAKRRVDEMVEATLHIALRPDTAQERLPYQMFYGVVGSAVNGTD